MWRQTAWFETPGNIALGVQVKIPYLPALSSAGRSVGATMAADPFPPAC
jgi:hypothetical protein